MKSIITSICAFIGLLLPIAAPTAANAHTITQTACAKLAQVDMIQNPPHTHQQRRQTFRRCLSYAKAHALVHKLELCNQVRGGWQAKNACRVLTAWPHSSRSGHEAVRVAWCEGSLSPDAINGEYRGTFQMGDGERARWGHGRTVATQALAAADYYEYDRDVMGRGGWGPWECHPGSQVEKDHWASAPRGVRVYG